LSFGPLGGRGEFCLFVRKIKNKDGVMCHGFLPDSRILYLEPKDAFKEIAIVRNKHQEDSTDG